MMPRRVFITGIGMISAIGIGVNATLDSLKKRQTGINRLTLFSSLHSHIPVAEIPLTNDQLVELTGITLHEEEKYSRNTLLALIASQQVFSNRKSVSGDRKTGLVMATTVGGMDLNEQYYQSLIREDTYKDYIQVLDSADCTEKVAAAYGIQHNLTTISTACSSSANAIMLGARFIRNGKLDQVLVGGTDALTKFTLNGFLALDILSPTGCRPFDAERNGLTIGEGAAMLMLESEETADPGKVICEVSGFANVNEAYHQTASSPEGTGAFMAMEKALQTAELQVGAINYINAHGTGTQVNDLAEATAIGNLFKDQTPWVSSTKAFTGHTLGAAGALEAALAALSIREQIVLPGLNCFSPMPEFSFPVVRETAPATIHHVLSNSFGFGGNNTSLVFSKV